MATRMGDANENGNEISNQRCQYNGTKRRSTRFSTPQPHHGFVFKAFTKESLLEKRKSMKIKKQSVAVVDNTGAKIKLEPDPYLASGQQLPPALVRQLPSELLGKPIEDIDPYYADQDTFVIISRSKELTRFSATEALCLLGPFHPIRRVVLYILVHPIFNLLVILTILINCILMTIQGSEAVEKTEIIFTIVYTTEMGLKVLARGFIVDEFTYLRDPWNWLDFAVIIMAYLTIVVQDLGNLSVMRTFRVLRALKTVAIIPGMKTIVGAVIDSVKNLKDVVVLTLFSLSVFSLLGLQIYMGQLTQKCIRNGPNNMSDFEWFTWCNKSDHWVPEPDDEIFGAYRLCGNATGAQSCPADHTCIQGFGPNPDYGFTNFDTFGWALICSFRLMTQDFWEGLYMQVLKTAGSWHIIFFIVSIFLGSIYLMNLILAIVAMSYNELQRRAEEEEEAAAEDEAAFLESCRMMELQEQMSDCTNSSQPGQTSYRPSVEIGLVGQSVLASLCQNGLLGQNVRDKLHQQMILPGIGDVSMRSQSLCVNLEQHRDRGVGAGSVQAQEGANLMNKRSSVTSTRYSHQAPSMQTASMTELRHKSISRLTSTCETPLRLDPNYRTSGETILPTSGRALSPLHHQQMMHRFQHSSSPRGKLSPHHVSSSVLMRRPSQDHREGVNTGRSSVVSDRDISALRQHAALIKIVSDDYSENPEVGASSSLIASSYDENALYREGREYKSLELTRSDKTLVDSYTTGNSRDDSEADQKQPQSTSQLRVNQSLGRTRSQDYSVGMNRSSQLMRVNERARRGYSKKEPQQQYHSTDAAICEQPTSIHPFANSSMCGTSYLRRSFQERRGVLNSSSQNTNSVDSGNRCAVEAHSTQKTIPLHQQQQQQQPPSQQLQQQQQDSTSRRNSAMRSSDRALHTSPQHAAIRMISGSVAGNVQQLGISRYLTQQAVGNMNHLSVENFQQFGLTKPAQQQQQQQQQAIQSTLNDENLLGGRRRLDSQANIHPSTMMRSHNETRQTANAIATTGGNSQMNTSAARRMSQDFARRASDWSRMSMTTNHDLRRLLRLWSHTNPYQGTRSRINSISNYSQANMDSPALSARGSIAAYSYQNNNSPRPSTVGSSRQAYELISAISRRRSRFYSDARYAMPLDDNMVDRMSVNLRDKCLAYCLSFLDILCIWECCGVWLKIQKLISLVVFDPFTELFIILCILINTLFMALDSDDADANMKSVFERGNYFFTATFAVEASMKIMALSPKFYFREGWNVFDSIIVGLSLLELGLEGVYGLSVLRSFRLLRVFKLAKSWPTLNLLISIMGKAVGDLGNLTFVLAIIVFIFAVMGMQLFGSKYVGDKFPSGELPRWNFTDFMHSFMIVFRILCAEWIEPMWDCLCVGGWPCIPFFLIAVTVGNLVVLNLFLALLLASFGASNLSSPQADNVDTKKLQEAIARFTRFGHWVSRKVARFFSWSTSFILRKRHRDGDGSQVANHEGDPYREQPIKSHIVAMSKLERLKNIELRTEELKSKIRRSPEHHYHLRQLAKSQVKESKRKSSLSSGYNFNYKNKPIESDSHLVNLPTIPIIVDEPVETDNDSEVTEDHRNTCLIRVQRDEEVSAQSEISHETEEVELPVPMNPKFDYDSQLNASSVGKPSSRFPNYFVNMHPIREDSRDDSSSSESDQAYKSLEGLAHDRASLSPQLRQMNSERATVQLKLEPKNLPVDEEEGLTEHLLKPTNDNRTSHLDSEQTEEQPMPDEQQEEDRPKSSLYLKAPKRQDMEEDDELALQHIETYIEKCICIGIVCLKWFILRQHVRKIVEHKYFDQCILLLIVISSGTLALEDKHLNERPTLKKTLDVLDTIFTIIFSLEMILKWLAFGVRRYFGNIWSWLDFVIVLVSFVNLMASIFGNGKIQALKTMRTLRAMRGLRPLRALQRFQGMRVVVNALIQAIPSIFNVLLVCLIFWLIFSIMGVQMFGGKFWRCLEPGTDRVVSYEEAANRIECIERNLTWANPQINFDNVLNAYLALFQVATFKGWIDIMNSATDSRNRDDQPIREANIYMYFYFVFFVIFGSFFTLNLFIGVIIDNFNEQKKKTGGSLEIFMTEDQKKYYHAMKKMKSKRPVKAMTRPKLKLQAYMFDITTSKKFDMAIMLIIGLNMLVMALEHYGQTPEFSAVLENLNLIFIAIFTLECLSKIFAMRHFYFREPWNVFDFIVVALSILGVVMKEYVAKYFVSPTLLRVVRVVKVGRVLRLVKGAKGIRTLLFALAMSLPALFNICLLLFLVMFIYAIFGMSFFMNVRKRAGIDETFNFETFSSSIIVLFQMSTSAAWDMVLDPLMDEENDCQKPDLSLGIEGTCGNKGIAIAYLISYVIVTFLIIINMYIAVILENYSQATEDVQEGLTDDDYEMYYEIWQKFDPDGTQYLPYEKLSDFVDALEDPLRIAKPNELALVVLDINIYEGNQCYCVDILDALTKFFFTRKGLIIQVNEHLQKVQSTLHETPFERITTTYLAKREHYCARVIQNCWRKWKMRAVNREQHNPETNIKTTL